MVWAYPFHHPFYGLPHVGQPVIGVVIRPDPLLLFWIIPVRLAAQESIAGPREPSRSVLLVKGTQDGTGGNSRGARRCATDVSGTFRNTLDHRWKITDQLLIGVSRAMWQLLSLLSSTRRYLRNFWSETEAPNPPIRITFCCICVSLGATHRNTRARLQAEIDRGGAYLDIRAAGSSLADLLFHEGRNSVETSEENRFDAIPVRVHPSLRLRDVSGFRQSHSHRNEHAAPPKHLVGVLTKTQDMERFMSLGCVAVEGPLDPVLEVVNY